MLDLGVVSQYIAARRKVSPVSRFSSRVELVANILIVAVAILLGVILVQKYLLKKAGPAVPSTLQPTIGSTVNLSDFDWTRHSKTLVLALQTQCHFCNESVPFYKRLIERANGQNVKLIAVFPSNKEESVAHLRELGIPDLEVRQASLDSLRVGGTPTLILTNDKGQITNYWVGKLSPNKETEVLTHLQ